MYSDEVSNKCIDFNSSKYFTINNEEGETLEMDRLFTYETWDRKIRESSLYIVPSFSEGSITFKIDGVYNRLDYLANFFPSNYGIGILFDYERDFGLSVNTLRIMGYELRDYNELDYWRFYINTIPDISYKTRKAYIKRLPYSISKRRGRQFDRLFKTGMHIDLHHVHGGTHNEQVLFHVSDQYNYGVKWLAGLFGLPYGSLVKRVMPWAKSAYIKFDSSGGDVTHLRFLYEMFDITCSTGKRGKELLAELGGCTVTSSQGNNLYHYIGQDHISFPSFHGAKLYIWRDLDRCWHRKGSKLPHVWSPKHRDYIRPWVGGSFKGLSGKQYFKGDFSE